MAVKILTATDWAETAGIRQGDFILKINGNPIRDFLDFQFHADDDDILSVEYLNRDSEILRVHYDYMTDGDMGIELEPHDCRECVNDCVFCFVDQMPPDLRPSLSVKDDDYAFSFVFGNFVSLTNLSMRQIERNVRLRLSPMYISVHTTDPILHRKMLRYRFDFDIMQRLRYLNVNEIEMHTQIVVVPGWNDGEALEKSITDLLSLDHVSTIGIVPVGLTRFREHLPELRRVNHDEARTIIEMADMFNRTQDINRVFCSDELYLLAGFDIPDEEYYIDFEQIENGIGMIRTLTENWKEFGYEYIEDIRQEGWRHIALVTGELAFPLIRSIAKEITNAGISAEAIAVKNRFLGESVTVAGLLTGSDIVAQVDGSRYEAIFFPSSILNTDGFTLDGYSSEELEKKLGCPLVFIDELMQQ